MRAARRLRTLIRRNSRGRATHAAAHADLHVVVPVSGSRAAVDFKHDSLGFYFDVCDLDLIAQPRGRTIILQCPFPGALIILTGALNDERLFRNRQDHFGRSKLGH
jgi:hypothetical protein